MSPKWLKRKKLTNEQLYAVEMSAIGFFLLLFAGQHLWFFVNVPSVREGILHSRGLALAMIEFEIAFGIWIHFGLLPRLTRWMTMGLFLFFTVASIFLRLKTETIGGYPFSSHFNQWSSTSFDIVTLGLLIYHECSQQEVNVGLGFASLDKKRLAKAAIVWAVVAAPVTELLVSCPRMNKTTNYGTSFTCFDGQETILLEPEKWEEGEIFPLQPFLVPFVQEKIAAGDWTVVLHRGGRVEGYDMISRLQEQGETQVLCIEFPPYPSVGANPSGFLYTRLTGGKVWRLDSPVTFRIHHQKLVRDKKKESGEPQETPSLAALAQN